MASVQGAIKIFARIKPVNGPLTTVYEINNSTTNIDEEILQVTCIKNPYDDHHFVNNKPEQYNFRYARVFDVTASQKLIFDEVSRPVIDSALLGYNGTIFAYGQTGSGKTFTMTGSSTKFNLRGIIPRTLQYIFKKLVEGKEASTIHSVFISYLEIYNEVGYDLLHTSDLQGNLEDLAKVTIMEDGNQQMHLKNLSVHAIEGVEEALQLLYIGDRNRAIAETPLNEVSTRSHCIFTIHLNIRDANSSIVKRSKIHLVDLAGSERVSNSCVTGHLLNEARHINLALHYLEQVIVALGDANRQHIPYRNSMMTSLLRDSLGGNCLTAMIATLSMESKNLQETLSTNRFAQRVALVQNAAVPNEELDPNLVITQLKSEVRKLKETIASCDVKPAGANSLPLSEEEQIYCENLVEQYLFDSDKNAILAVKPDMRFIQECFRLLKSQSSTSSRNNSQIAKIYGNTNLGDDNSMAQLVSRREAEIKVLMSMLRKEKTKKSSTAGSSENLLASFSQNHESHHQNTILPLSKLELSLSKKAVDDSYALLENEFEEVIKPKKVVVKKPQTPIKQPKKVVKANIVTKKENQPEKVLPSTEKAATSYSTEEEKLMSDITGLKKRAIGPFMQNYKGTTELNQVRKQLLEEKSEITKLESVLGSQHENIDSLKLLVDNALNHEQMQEALESQVRTRQMQIDRLSKARSHFSELEKTLKEKFRSLLNDFETWWNKDTGDTSDTQGEVEELVDENQNSIINILTADSFKNVGMGTEVGTNKRTIHQKAEPHQPITNIEQGQDSKLAVSNPKQILEELESGKQIKIQQQENANKIHYKMNANPPRRTTSRTRININQRKNSKEELSTLVKALDSDTKKLADTSITTQISSGKIFRVTKGQHQITEPSPSLIPDTTNSNMNRNQNSAEQSSSLEDNNQTLPHMQLTTKISSGKLLGMTKGQHHIVELSPRPEAANMINPNDVNQNVNLNITKQNESPEVTYINVSSNKTRPKIMTPSNTQISPGKKLSLPKSIENKYNYKIPTMITIPNKELFYVPGEIRPPPKAPPVSPVMSHTAVQIKKPEIDLTNVLDQQQVKQPSVSDEDDAWIKNLPLTGDKETDNEVIKFFKQRRLYSASRNQSATNIKEHTK